MAPDVHAVSVPAGEKHRARHTAGYGGSFGHQVPVWGYAGPCGPARPSATRTGGPETSRAVSARGQALTGAMKVRRSGYAHHRGSGRALRQGQASR